MERWWVEKEGSQLQRKTFHIVHSKLEEERHLANTVPISFAHQLFKQHFQYCILGKPFHMIPWSSHFEMDSFPKAFLKCPIIHFRGCLHRRRSVDVWSVGGVPPHGSEFPCTASGPPPGVRPPSSSAPPVLPAFSRHLTCCCPAAWSVTDSCPVRFLGSARKRKFAGIITQRGREKRTTIYHILILLSADGIRVSHRCYKYFWKPQEALTRVEGIKKERPQHCLLKIIQWDEDFSLVSLWGYFYKRNAIGYLLLYKLPCYMQWNIFIKESSNR